MNIEQRIDWCIQQAEEIGRNLPPREDPHMWSAKDIAVHFWREMAWKLVELQRENAA